VEFWRTLVLVIQITIEVYAVLVVVRLFVAYVVHKQNNLTAFVYRLTEPCLKLFRKLLPRRKTGFDWSLVLVILTLQLIIFLLVLLRYHLS